MEVKPSSIQTVDISVEDLVPNPNNTNEMDEAALNRLKIEIDEVGFIDPLQVIPIENGKYMILGGEHRWKAAKLAGYQYITCCVLTGEQWSDADHRDLVTFRLNHLHGKDSPEKLMAFYQRLAKKFGEDNLQQVLAITSTQAWTKIKKGVVNQLKHSGLSKEMMDKVVEAEKKAITPDDFSKRLGKILKVNTETADTNFFVFTHGKKEHLLVNVNSINFQLMKKIMEVCSETKTDVNSYLEPILTKVVGGLRADEIEGSL